MQCRAAPPSSGRSPISRHERQRIVATAAAVRQNPLGDGLQRRPLQKTVVDASLHAIRGEDQGIALGYWNDGQLKAGQRVPYETTTQEECSPGRRARTSESAADIADANPRHRVLMAVEHRQAHDETSTSAQTLVALPHQPHDVWRLSLLQQLDALLRDRGRCLSVTQTVEYGDHRAMLELADAEVVS
jgi:hypothetical protein